MNKKDRKDSPNSKEGNEIARLLEFEEATQTIDLSSLLTRDTTSSGSFDIRGQIWSTTFGKLLQALPIPALLIDQSYTIVVANQACARIYPGYEKLHGSVFPGIFPKPSSSPAIEGLLEQIFLDRKTKVTESLLQIEKHTMWSRMTLRPIRIMDTRFILAILEDLTSEKSQIALQRKHEKELQKAHTELESLVQERTADLHTTNEALKMLIGGLEERIKEQQEKASLNLALVVKPLLDQLKAEKLTETARRILDAVESHLQNMFSDYGSQVAKIWSLLTPKEIQICDHIRSGLTSKQIGEAMGISVDTVNFHRQSIRKKLGLTDAGDNLVSWIRTHLGIDKKLVD
jgi:DNA-binding CsgD family transcriptional regulator